jgi:hypothetical protein
MLLHNLPRFLVLPEPHKPCVPETIPKVHSRNSTCATRSGRSHKHFFILSAVRASPQRDGCNAQRCVGNVLPQS